MEIVINQFLSKDEPPPPPPSLLVFLCGPISQAPQFTDNMGKPVIWWLPEVKDGDIESASYGFGPQCRYTPVKLPSSDAFRQAILTGSAGTAVSRRSGDRILYALPALATSPTQVPLADLNPARLPNGTTLSVSVAVPDDLQNIIASPQLPDEGIHQWIQTVGMPNRLASEFRLSGDLRDEQIAGQRRLFIAGALVGVSGGALVWLLEMTANLVLSRIRWPLTEESEDAQPAVHVATQ